MPHLHCFRWMFLTLLVVSPISIAAAEEAIWPQWRGPSQQGIAPQGEYPLAWDEHTVRAVEIPGLGGSTPVVVEDIAYLTSGIDGKNHLLAVNVRTADLLWKTPLGTDRGNKHRKGSGSNPSPVTDGKHIVSYFRSGDLVCVDRKGKLVWQQNLQDEFGEDTLWWDLGSSPLLVDSMVVVAVMQTGPSYLVAYDIASGELKWKSDRQTDAPEEAAQSYSTPLAVEVNGQTVIAVMGADHLTLNAVDDGRELARLGGFNPDQEKYFRSISSPVAEGEVVVCPYARGATLTAVNMSELIAGKGRDAIIWQRDDLGSDVPTPALQNGTLYVVYDGKKDGDKEKGMVFALDLQSGQTKWQVTLPRTRISYSSSPLIAGDCLYVTNEKGSTSVIGPLSAQGTPEVLGTNVVPDEEPFTVASPVPIRLSDERWGVIQRTRNQLYLIGQTDEDSQGS